MSAATIADLRAAAVRSAAPVTVSGRLADVMVRPVYDGLVRTGRTWLSAHLVDGAAQVEVLFFPAVLADVGDLVVDGATLTVSGLADCTGGSAQLVVSGVAR